MANYVMLQKYKWGKLSYSLGIEILVVVDFFFQL
jgi:hypothetical protein